MTPERFLAFGIPSLGEDEEKAVLEVMRTSWIGTGPKVEEFEAALGDFLGAKECVAVSSCTAALHLALLVSGVGPGDEVITTSLTFPATIRAIEMTGATPVLADIDPESLNIDPESVSASLNSRTKVILPVHFGGLPCDITSLRQIADDAGDVKLVADAAHALGAYVGDTHVGSECEYSCFSFYPNKNLTTCEGGAISVDSGRIANRLRSLRLHGLSNDAWKRFGSSVINISEVEEAGFKYNLTDLQAAIGLAQLGRFNQMQTLRSEYASLYDAAFKELKGINLINTKSKGVTHAYHMYILAVDEENVLARDEIVKELRNCSVGATVHYLPVHQHKHFKDKFASANLENTETVASRIFSLPISPALKESEVDHIISSVRDVVETKLA